MSDDPNKDFDGWHSLKKRIDSLPNPPKFNTREVWWCSLGINVGHEQDGKHEPYHRPVIVLRKFNDHLFVGIPLTTGKAGPYKFPIYFNDLHQFALISQIRLFDARRFGKRIGRLSKTQHEKVREAVKQML